MPSFIFAVLAIFDVLMILYCSSLIFRLIGVKSNLPNDDITSQMKIGPSG